MSIILYLQLSVGYELKNGHIKIIIILLQEMIDVLNKMKQIKCAYRISDRKFQYSASFPSSDNDFGKTTIGNLQNGYLP